ncbi:MAG: hypothetical protein ACE15B_11970 [Bryobacteraceae bacterium]
MGKRIAFMVVGAGIGGLVGLLAAFLAGGGNWPIVICTAAGAAAPFFMGRPGK